jgi:hypothetical protein
MEAEVLERLLMDRALGGLSPDVEALLTAHLAQDADAADRAREFDAAATAARQVLQSGGPLTLPRFPAARIRGLEHTRRQLVLVRNVAGIAASVIVGIGLGVAFFRGSAAAPESVRAPIAVVSTAGSAAPRGEFWSAERLYEKSRRTEHLDAVRLIWDSAVSTPRLGVEL